MLLFPEVIMAGVTAHRPVFILMVIFGRGFLHPVWPRKGRGPQFLKRGRWALENPPG